MFIRYQIVRNFLLAGLAIGLFAWIASPGDPPNEKTPTPKPVRYRVKPTTVRKPVPVKAAMQTRAMRVANSRAKPNSKRKDALGPNSRWKVNLYEETGDNRYDRMKIDTNRDGSWDQKWTRKQGNWRRDSKKSVAPRRPLHKPSPVPLYSQIVRRFLKTRATKKKLKDALGSSGPKVNLYDDDRDGRWDRAKVDRDRNGSWDEEWTLKSGRLERKLTPGGKVLIWHNGHWHAKKK